MAKADIEEVLDVPKDKLFDVITRYEEYPEFVTGVRKIEVERKGPGKARCKYHVSMIKDIEYTLDITDDRDAGTIQWSLVESDAMKVNNGFWKLTAEGDDQTHVRYELEVEFSFPVPGFVLKKLVKGSLGPMVRSFEERVLSL